MGLNRKRGRISNSIKAMAKEYVDKEGFLAYHYACYNCAFDGGEQAVELDYPLIDCIVKELKKRNLW